MLECEKNNKIYAIKIIKSVQRYIEEAQIEVSILQGILTKNGKTINHPNILRLIDHFPFSKNNKNYYGIVFERLGLSLYEFLKMNNFKPFSISQIQHIAQQILEAVAFIHESGYIHTDLKPENILFVNSEYEKKYGQPFGFEESENTSSTGKHEKSPNSLNGYSNQNKNNSESKSNVYLNVKDTKIKIIDFGGAVEKSEVGYGIINTRQYRSPEVILQSCMWRESSDVWSIGCILVELYTGELLFGTHNNEEHLCLIEKVCGHYPRWLIDNAREKDLLNIFIRGDSDFMKINIRKCENYEDVKIALTNQRKLEECISPKHYLFKCFLYELLNMDCNKRKTCRSLLEHAFFREDFKDENY